jgi:hypothetical protein
MNRWARGALVASLGTCLFGAAIAAAPSAHATDDCPLLQPACLVDTVHESVDDTTQIVGQAVDEIEGEVDRGTAAIDGVIDRVLGGGGVGPDLPGGGGGNGGGGNDGGGGGGGGGDGPGTGDHHGAGRVDHVPPREAALLVEARETGTTTAPARPPTGAGGRGHHVAPTPSIGGQVVAHTITGVLVMTVLLALIAGFVAFQHALDHGDPKLAPATMATDRVSFT